MKKTQNDPRSTWKLASYLPPERRKNQDDQRKAAERAKLGERRDAERRTLSSLQKL